MHHEITTWLQNYIQAWRSPATADLAAIFTPDISYRVSPWKPPYQGLAAVTAFWQKSIAAGEVFEYTSEIIAVEGRTAVIRLEVTYHETPPNRWRDLWVVTLNETGRCCRFEEWPFAPERRDGHEGK